MILWWGGQIIISRYFQDDIDDIVMRQTNNYFKIFSGWDRDNDKVNLLHCLTISWQEQKCLQLIIWFWWFKLDWRTTASIYGPFWWHFEELFFYFWVLDEDLLPAWRRLRNNCLSGFPHQLHQGGAGAQPPTASIVWQTPSELVPVSVSSLFKTHLCEAG